MIQKIYLLYQGPKALLWALLLASAPLIGCKNGESDPLASLIQETFQDRKDDVAPFSWEATRRYLLVLRRLESRGFRPCSFDKESLPCYRRDVQPWDQKKERPIDPAREEAGVYHLKKAVTLLFSAEPGHKCYWNLLEGGNLSQQTGAYLLNIDSDSAPARINAMYWLEGTPGQYLLSGENQSIGPCQELLSR